MNNEIKSFDGLIPDIEYSLKGIIKKIDREGEPDKKRPVSLIIQIEETGRICKMCSWDYSALDTFKDASTKRLICEVTFKASKFKDSLSFKISELTPTKKVSKLPEEKEYDSNEEKDGYVARINELLNSVSNENYKNIVNKLILENPNFFTWRAAKACHHAFDGGLVYHSYNVCVNAINLANTYVNTQDFVVDFDLLITGALLHDIGKLKEYAKDGEFTFLGHLMSHLVIGVELIDDACRELGIDQYSEDILKLKHIIVSHHGELQYGSPNTPILPEAYMIHMSDEADAGCEAMVENLKYMNTGDLSGTIRSLDDGKVYKLY